MPSIKGTSSVSSTRALEKALKRTKFPACFSQKVDLAKVNKPVLTHWIETKITELLGFEDEIVQCTAVNLFLPVAPEDSTMQPTVDPRTAQVDLTGFLGEEGSATFAEELWQLMIDAQEQAMGIPRKILDQKKKELELQKLSEAARAPPPPPPHAAAPRRDYQYNDNFDQRREPQRYSGRPVSPPQYYRDGDWRGNDGRGRDYPGALPPRDGDAPRHDEFGRRIQMPQQPSREEAHDASRHRDDSRRQDGTHGRRTRRRDDDSDSGGHHRRHHRDHERSRDDRRAEASRRRHRSRSPSSERRRRARRRRSRSPSSSSTSYSSASSSSSSSRSRGDERGKSKEHTTVPSDIVRQT